VLDIKQNSKLSVGEIIRDLREQNNMSQDALATAALFNRSKLSQIELGEIECPRDLLASLKTVLKINLLPLTEDEHNDFREMLHHWHLLIDEYKMDEAVKMHEELSIIKIIPHDRELNILFSLFECKMFLCRNKLDVAKDVLDELDAMEDDFSDIQLYPYHCNHGTFNLKSSLYREALDAYLKSYEVVKGGMKESVVFFYNVSRCYDQLGYVAMAIIFSERALKLYEAGQKSIFERVLCNSLGVYYANIGHLPKASEHLFKALTIAERDYKDRATYDNKKYLGMALLNLGFMFRKTEKWRTAIEYVDKAMPYLEDGSEFYLEALYEKVFSIIQKGNALECAGMIKDGLKMSTGMERYTIMFQSLERLVRMDIASIEFFEEKAIPFFVKNNIYTLVLDYGTIVKKYFEKNTRNTKTRLLEVSYTMCNVFEKMLKGDVIV